MMYVSLIHTQSLPLSLPASLSPRLSLSTPHVKDYKNSQNFFNITFGETYMCQYTTT